MLSALVSLSSLGGTPSVDVDDGFSGSAIGSNPTSTKTLVLQRCAELRVA